MLEPFGPSLYLADGPTVPFCGFPYPTRMALARLADGSAWVWSPVALSAELEREVEAIGPVRHIVSPNKLHHLFLRRGPARAARERVLGWQPERLLIAHGECAQSGATQIVARALRWI